MKKQLTDFLKDKKVLVTGHTGFIGSWLTICLNELGAEITGYALPPYTENDNFVVTNLKDKINHNIGDIRDFENLSKIFKESQPEIVLHLAAQPLVRRSYLTPKETYDTNVGGTVNVFEVFRDTQSCKILINFTSDKCYENKETLEGYKETDNVGGYDPYSSSKACSELITSAYRHTFFNNINENGKKFVSSIRSGNVIGGGDWREARLITDCMKALRKKEPVFIRNPDYIRPWQFVLEPIMGMLLLSLKMWDEDSKYSGAWNFGPKRESVFSVIEIVQKLFNYMGKGEYKIANGKRIETMPETKLLMLNSSKAEKKLEWKQILNIDETIKLVCDWYMEENVSYDFDVNQINYYLEKIKEQ